MGATIYCILINIHLYEDLEIFQEFDYFDSICVLILRSFL